MERLIAFFLFSNYHYPSYFLVVYNVGGDYVGAIGGNFDQIGQTYRQKSGRIVGIFDFLSMKYSASVFDTA
jgi:hypothetical protein